jgi:hypothetical protein
MANRYWVGGTGSWTTSSTTNWSASSGGASGASVPTAADSVFFDQAGTYTVTMTGALLCLDITVSAGTVTFASTGTLAISGSMTLLVGTVWSHTGGITFNSTTTGKTITTNGVTIASAITFNGVGGGWALGSALTVSRVAAGAVTLTNGTLDLNGQTLTLSATATATFLTATGTKNLTFNGGSLVLAASGSNAFNMNAPIGFTTTAGTGTGTISLTSASAKTFIGGGLTYNCAINQGGAGALTISGSNTFSNITNTYSATGATTITLTAGTTQTCTDFTATGTVGKVLTLNTTGATATINASVRPSTLNYIAATNIVANRLPFFLGTGSTVTTCTNVFASAYIAPFTHYWVGGTGTWSTVATANWSATSGGASGAAVPFLDENVVFDQAGTYTVTRTGALTCQDFTVSAGTVTFASTGTLAISGSMTLLAGTVWSATGANTFNSTSTGRTITTNGVTIGGNTTANITFNGIGGEWTLGSALTSPATIGVSAGTFSTSASNYSVTARVFQISGGTVNLNGSTITTTLGTGFSWDLSGGTLNAGTSQITFSGFFTSVGRTYYNVTGSGDVPAQGHVMQGGDNTFNNLTLLSNLFIGSNATINGTLTLSSTGLSYTNRRRVYAQFPLYSLTVANLAAGTEYWDFFNITITGAAAPISGTSFGDAGGNSGITFTAAKTVYWNLAGTQNWTSTGWATTAAGTPAAANYPLAQDTAIFTNSGSAGTVTVNSFVYIGNLDMSGRTSAMTFSLASTPTFCGNWSNGTGITLVDSGTTLTFSPRSTSTITGNGVAFPFAVSLFTGATRTLQLVDDVIMEKSFLFSNGIFDLNGRTLTLSNTTSSGGFSTGTILSNLGAGREIIFNGGLLVIAASGATAFNNNTPTQFITTAGTGTGTISLTSASAKTFVGGSDTYNCTLNQGGAGALTVTGSNTFNNITNTYNATGATSILFTAATTSTFTNWNASGAAGRLLTIGSVTAASHTLSKASGTVSADFLSISRSTATGGATWNAGANSINGGNNTGWIFALAPSSTGNFFALF